jgi:hypothetical protein
MLGRGGVKYVRKHLTPPHEMEGASDGVDRNLPRRAERKAREPSRALTPGRVKRKRSHQKEKRVPPTRKSESAALAREPGAEKRQPNQKDSRNPEFPRETARVLDWKGQVQIDVRDVLCDNPNLLRQ